MFFRFVPQGVYERTALNPENHPRGEPQSRRTRPLGITDKGFQSQASAEIAANLALKEFLEALAKRTKR
jgi:hypothetical protein